MPNRFKISEMSVRLFLRDPVGEVAKMVEKLADKVFSVASNTVPVRTGETRDSIKVELQQGATLRDVQKAEVSASYAVFFLEKGTKRHFIFRHAWLFDLNDDSSLKSAEGQYFGPIVHHPGITPRPFLTEGLWSLSENDI